MACPPVRGDNQHALASRSSYVQVDKYGITILYHQRQCRPCTSQDILCLSWYVLNRINSTSEVGERSKEWDCGYHSP